MNQEPTTKGEGATPAIDPKSSRARILELESERDRAVKELAAAKSNEHVAPDREDVMPGEVAALHTQMPYPPQGAAENRGHPAYRQRHDAKCYFCALLDALSEAESLANRAVKERDEWEDKARRWHRTLRDGRCMYCGGALLDGSKPCQHSRHLFGTGAALSGETRDRDAEVERLRAALEDAKHYFYLVNSGGLGTTFTGYMTANYRHEAERLYEVCKQALSRED